MLNVQVLWLILHFSNLSASICMNISDSSICVPLLTSICEPLAKPLDFYGARFQNQSEIYFHTNIMPPGFVTDITYYLNALTITANWRQACFPEAVHVLALKLKELAYLADLNTVHSFFVNQVTAALAHCTACNLWIHTKSLFDEISALVARPRLNTTVDLVASFCGASSHSPGGSFAANTDSLDWLRDLLVQAPGSSKVRLFIMEKCAHKATEAERQLRYDALTEAVRSLVSHIAVSVVEEELRADDCTAYLKFITDNYDDLSDFVFFIHPDIEEHAMMPLVERVIKAVMNGVLSSTELPVDENSAPPAPSVLRMTTDSSFDPLWVGLHPDACSRLVQASLQSLCPKRFNPFLSLLQPSTCCRSARCQRHFIPFSQPLL